jgi:hypothetical protein
VPGKAPGYYADMVCFCFRLCLQLNVFMQGSDDEDYLAEFFAEAGVPVDIETDNDEDHAGTVFTRLYRRLTACCRAASRRFPTRRFTS